MQGLTLSRRQRRNDRIITALCLIGIFVIMIIIF